MWMLLSELGPQKVTVTGKAGDNLSARTLDWFLWMSEAAGPTGVLSEGEDRS